MEKIDKYKGKIEHKKSYIDLLLKDNAAIEKMVDYGELTTYSGKSDPIVRQVLKEYIINMLKSARD